MLDTDRPTRGHGTLESFLAARRAAKADALIPGHHRTGRVLDIGCGTFPTFLSRAVFTEKWGVDQIFDAPTRLALHDGHAHLVPYDANRDDALPFDAEQFSVVTMLAVFEHIPQDRLVPLLKEVHRVLRHDGLFVMTTPAHWTGWLLRAMARLKLVSHLEILEHKGSYDHDYIHQKLVAAGFDERGIRRGSFEFKANLWVTAAKQNGDSPMRRDAKSAATA